MSTQPMCPVTIGNRLRRPLVILSLALWFTLSGCLGIPDNARAIDNFELDRYLGTWFEIARLDHRFERGLSHVTATYRRRNDGGINVINRGFDAEDGKWSEADGKAYPIGDPTTGRLKVSFFGPFYGAYNIIELDDQYQYALVSGPNTDYLWILSRQPQLSPSITERLVDKARQLGFPVQELIYVSHSVTKDSVNGPSRSTQ